MHAEQSQAEPIWLSYTQYGPIKNSHIKTSPQILEKNKEPALRILDLPLKNVSALKFLDLKNG